MEEKLEFGNRNSRIEKIKMILPILWSSYQHIYEARETATQNKINFLLIVVSFLPVICIALCSTFENDLFLIPTMFQFLALLVLLKSFFVVGRKAQRIPWLNVSLPPKPLGDDTLRELEDNAFEIRLFAGLKAAEEDTGIYMKEKNRVIKLALYLIMVSIFLMSLAYLFVLMKRYQMLTPWFPYAGEGLSILFLFLLPFYEKIPRSEFNKKHEAFEQRIEEWAKT